MSHESYIIVQINLEGKAPKSGEAYVELKSPMATTMQDMGLPIPAPPKRDVQEEHRRVQQELAEKAAQNIGYNKKGQIVRIEPGYEFPQFSAREPDVNVISQPAALKPEQVLITHMVDYSVPPVKDMRVSNMSQPEVREVKVSIHPDAHLGIATITAARKATQMSAVNFTAKTFAQGARVAIDDPRCRHNKSMAL